MREDRVILSLEPLDAADVVRIDLRYMPKRETIVLQSILTHYRLLFRGKVKSDEELLIFLPLEDCNKVLKRNERMKRARVAILYNNDRFPHIEVYPVTAGYLYPTKGGFAEILRHDCHIGISFLPKDIKTPSTYGNIPFDQVCYCDTDL